VYAKKPTKAGNFMQVTSLGNAFRVNIHWEQIRIGQREKTRLNLTKASASFVGSSRAWRILQNCPKSEEKTGSSYSCVSLSPIGKSWDEECLKRD
jgi:hypothetical protein